MLYTEVSLESQYIALCFLLMWYKTLQKKSDTLVMKRVSKDSEIDLTFHYKNYFCASIF